MYIFTYIQSLSLYIYIYLPIYLSIYISTYLSIYLPIYQSIYLFIYLTVCMCISVYIYNIYTRRYTSPRFCNIPTFVGYTSLQILLSFATSNPFGHFIYKWVATRTTVADWSLIVEHMKNNTCVCILLQLSHMYVYIRITIFTIIIITITTINYDY